MGSRSASSTAIPGHPPGHPKPYAAALRRHLRLNNGKAHDVVIRATDCGAITTSQIPAVLARWRKPVHEEFQPRTAWSLFNAFTEVFKSVNPHTAINRCEALHGLFDGVEGIALPS